MSLWLNDEDKESHLPPRANRVLLPAGLGVLTEIWMGGGHSAFGHDIDLEQVRDAWIVDCANEFPLRFRDAAGLTIFRVFTDTEEPPHNWERLDGLALSLGSCILGVAHGRDGWEHPHEPPARLYIVCKQGMNRSGLMAGRILRALGVPGDEAVAAVRLARPGALNNITFERLVRE